MACLYHHYNTNAINSLYIQQSIDKSSLSPALNILKLLKTVRKIFNHESHNKKSHGITKQMISGPVVISTCLTEEEHHNALNEQYEQSAVRQLF